MTSVELLPVHTFVNDSYLEEKGLANYWGSSTIGFLRQTHAMPRTSPTATVSSRRRLRVFMAAGLEIILVVYSHTAEGKDKGRPCPSRGSTTHASGSN